MISVLFLSKNVLVEKTLQSKLQRLNYEVLCSPRIFYLLMEKTEMTEVINYFDYIILSETISEEEVNTVLASLLNKTGVIIRKFESVPENEEAFYMEGIADWISEDLSTETIREKLFRLSNQLSPPSEGFSIQRNMGMQLPREKKPLNTLSLSRLERLALEKLFHSKGRVVSREELCHYLWGEPTSNSHLSQVSLLMRKLRTAFEREGIEGKTIETCWGEGYALMDTIYEHYTANEEVPEPL
ncbi:hypothetical protein I588_01781 [Enterococcus pallens ATCC BAA-351]|uniref:OmpR/PhoB-type domain-containing protein n=2 Tax=Enterococcus pallens TaxID=160454 RepID=R2QM48_9ENTE|nr:hypothetical protein UAU_00315 [Enterococcus pallens ATCC BAA-351]EOU20934.1 hypothetical protein I588_01781 [Enterococcus pallens ATCC BAA-351]